MDEIKIVKYWDENTVQDYERLRNIAYEENIVNNILVWTVKSPKYDLYLIYKDWRCVGFGWYHQSKKDPLSHNYTMENFYVLKELQWQWIMWKLYDFMENEIIWNWDKIIRIEGKVTETNEKSLRFLKKHWFYQYGFAKNRIYDKEKNQYLWTVLMEKIIEL